MKKEVWMNRFAELVEVWFGPCSCHPGDMILTWGKGFYHSGSYSFKSERGARNWLKRNGYERLENE